MLPNAANNPPEKPRSGLRVGHLKRACLIACQVACDFILFRISSTAPNGIDTPAQHATTRPMRLGIPNETKMINAIATTPIELRDMWMP